MFEEACVENGVRLLDKKIPGWHTLIDWERLDIYGLSDCIVGQLEKYGMDRSDLIPDGFSGSYIYGFDTWFGQGPDTYGSINAAWRNWWSENKQYRH